MHVCFLSLVLLLICRSLPQWWLLIDKLSIIDFCFCLMFFEFMPIILLRAFVEVAEQGKHHKLKKPAAAWVRSFMLQHAGGGIEAHFQGDWPPRYGWGNFWGLQQESWRPAPRIWIKIYKDMPWNNRQAHIINVYHCKAAKLAKGPRTCGTWIAEWSWKLRFVAVLAGTSRCYVFGRPLQLHGSNGHQYQWCLDCMSQS